MGQRLVINVKRGDADLAAIYYHWSAYSTDALWELTQLYEHVLENSETMTDKELQLAMIRFLENKHDELMEKTFGHELHGGIYGGSESTEWGYATKLFPNEKFVDHPDRNTGLIALSEDGIGVVNSWAEGTIDVDLSSGMVDNNVIDLYEDEDQVREYYDDEMTEDDIISLDIDPSHFKLKDVKKVSDVLNEVGDGFFWCDGMIAHCID